VLLLLLLLLLLLRCCCCFFVSLLFNAHLINYAQLIN
jgi:hypothetical protein